MQCKKFRHKLTLPNPNNDMHLFRSDRGIHLPSGRQRLCAVQAFCHRQNLGAGRIHFARAFQSPKGGATNGSETQKKMRLVDTSRIFFCPVLIKKMQPGTGPHTVGRRFCAVQAFLRSKNLGAGAIHLPRAFEIPKGRGRLWRPEPKKKDTTYVVSFFLANPNTIDALKMGNDFMRNLTVF